MTEWGITVSGSRNSWRWRSTRSVWQFRNETGEGTMTTYEIFPGAILSFNNFHMAQFESRYVADRRLFALDHCREGRMEYAPGSNMLAYTAAGDIKLGLRKQHTAPLSSPPTTITG